MKSSSVDYSWSIHRNRRCCQQTGGFKRHRPCPSHNPIGFPFVFQKTYHTGHHFRFAKPFSFIVQILSDILGGFGPPWKRWSVPDGLDEFSNDRRRKTFSLPYHGQYLPGIVHQSRFSVFWTHRFWAVDHFALHPTESEKSLFKIPVQMKWHGSKLSWFETGSSLVPPPWETFGSKRAVDKSRFGYSLCPRVSLFRWCGLDRFFNMFPSR